MKLLIDLGNTRFKWASLNSGKFNYEGASTYQEDSIETLLERACAKHKKISDIYIASVLSEQISASISQWNQANAKAKLHFAEVSAELDGLVNGYEQVDTLGIDRWMSLLAVKHRYKQTVCVIDCGTSITVDALSFSGTHFGGLIVPGVEMMQTALTVGTHGCELQKDQTESQSSLFAKNTHQAITKGCLYMALSFIERIQEEVLQELGSEVKFILTGGDAELLMPYLDSEYVHEPQLVLKGLVEYSKLS